MARSLHELSGAKSAGRDREEAQAAAMAAQAAELDGARAAADDAKRALVEAEATCRALEGRLSEALTTESVGMAPPARVDELSAALAAAEAKAVTAMGAAAEAKARLGDVDAQRAEAEAALEEARAAAAAAEDAPAALAAKEAEAAQLHAFLKQKAQETAALVAERKEAVAAKRRAYIELASLREHAGDEDRTRWLWKRSLMNAASWSTVWKTSCSRQRIATSARRSAPRCSRPRTMRARCVWSTTH